MGVVVINYEGEFYVLWNNCMYKDFLLFGGDVLSGKIICEKYGGKFELMIGKVWVLFVVKVVKIYKIEVEGGVVYVFEF